MKPSLLSPLHTFLIRVRVAWPGGSPIGRQTRRTVLDDAIRRKKHGSFIFTLNIKRLPSRYQNELASTLRCSAARSPADRRSPRPSHAYPDERMIQRRQPRRFQANTCPGGRELDCDVEPSPLDRRKICCFEVKRMFFPAFPKHPA